MDAEELQHTLKLHHKWCLGDSDGVHADLRSADLRSANLWGADLCGADLCGTNLCGANLRGANLRSADLRGADLRGADLRSADLCGTNLPVYQLPAGDLVVYKKLRHSIAALRIDAHFARTATLVGRKCRCDGAFVLSLSRGQSDRSIHDGTEYAVGEYVYPDSYDPNPAIECTHGIHFFLTREEAEAY